MSTELLREAAALMRERAEAATLGPWVVTPAMAPEVYAYPGGYVKSRGVSDQESDEVADTMMHADSAHIASWHPVVALAVADSLIAAAAHIESHDCEAHCELDGCEHVLTAARTARAYLGRDA